MNSSTIPRSAALFCLLASLTGVAATTTVAAQAPPDAAIARIDGKAIPYSVLQPTIRDPLGALQLQYDTQMQQLTQGAARAREEYVQNAIDKFVDQRVLALEARAVKSTPEALLAAVKTPTVSALQIRAFYDAQRAQIGQSFESVAPQVKEYLQKQANDHAVRRFLDALRLKYRAAVTREPLREPVAAVGAQRGPDAAPVTIVEFSDFQCPFCARLAPVMRQILEAYPAQVRLIYRNLPLGALHPDAGNAAQAAVCSGSQGKFWEMHDLLFAEQNALSLAALREKAQRLGLDTVRFNECLDSATAREAVNQDAQAGAELGIVATPSSFVNGRFVNGAVSFDDLSALVNDELRRAAPKAHR